MNKYCEKLRLGLFLFLVVGCTTKRVMEDNNARFKDINEEYEKVVTVDAIPEAHKAPGVLKRVKESDARNTVKATSEIKSSKVGSGLSKAAQKAAPVEQKKHEPSIEDGEGFLLRRPVVDPYGVGEKVVLSVNYFNVEAGDLSLNVRPHKVVNGHKAYNFSLGIKSTKMFSLFYAVDNSAETFVDFDSMLPLTYSAESKETARRKEARAYFDWSKNEATYWEKSIKKEGQEEKKKVVWGIEPYTQNIISALFYLRAFQLTPGKKFAFRVADNGKNYVFHAEILRREKLATKIGELNTVVIKPTFELEDQFKPTGDILFWLTDDDRKFIVRIESKIKIGTLVGKVKSIERGVREN